MTNHRPVNEEVLVGYVMDSLEPGERAEVEALLRTDPDLKERLDRIRSCLEQAKQCEEPSPPLAGKTCRLVGRIRKGFGSGPSLSESTDGLRPLRRATMLDWAFVGGIAAAVVMLVAPAVRSSRETARRLQCQENLKTVTHELMAYAERNRGLPHIGPTQNAGSFALELARNNPHLRELLETRLVCPASELAEKVSSGTIVMRLPNDREMAAAPPEAAALLRRIMGGSYAYRIGYLDAKGDYCAIKVVRPSDTPLLADAPSPEVPGFRSVAHEARGFNMAYCDGSVRFRDRCATSGPDAHVFLNAHGDHRAGVYAQDVVLARSEAEPLATPVVFRKDTGKK